MPVGHMNIKEKKHMSDYEPQEGDRRLSPSGSISPFYRKCWTVGTSMSLEEAEEILKQQGYTVVYEDKYGTYWRKREEVLFKRDL
jgi:hypothetical protein